MSSDADIRKAEQFGEALKRELRATISDAAEVPERLKRLRHQLENIVTAEDIKQAAGAFRAEAARSASVTKRISRLSSAVAKWAVLEEKAGLDRIGGREMTTREQRLARGRQIVAARKLALGVLHGTGKEWDKVGSLLQQLRTAVDKTRAGYRTAGDVSDDITDADDAGKDSGALTKQFQRELKQARGAAARAKQIAQKLAATIKGIKL